MNLSDIREYLKKIFPEAEHFYIGRIDASQEKCIGIYNGQTRPAIRCIGLQTYQEMSVSILIHWTENARETQSSALALYQRLYHADCPEINGYHIPVIHLQSNAPVDCTPPESLIYEYVIDLNLIYNL